jgi:hypothetical protein
MILVILVTIASYALAWLSAVPWLMPFLNAAGAWWVMAGELRRGRTGRAIAVMLVWAATMAVISTGMAASGSTRSEEGTNLFLRSSYRNEMIAWVRTGVGPESTPSVFIPRHLEYAGLFAATSFATGGVFSMPMGAALMNQMGEYVGSMAAQSKSPLASAVLGWHPWAVLRIIGFVMIGVVLSGVLLSRLMNFPFSLVAERRWLAIGAALLLVDIVLKWLLAPAWGEMLKGLAGW